MPPFWVLLVHQGDDRMGGVGVELGRVRVLPAQHRTGVGHDGDLHAQTDAEIGNAMLAGVICRAQHALDAA